MAIVPRKRKNGSIYKAIYRDLDKKQKSKNFKRKIDAEKWLLEKTSKLNKPENLKIPKRLKVKEFYDIWVEQVVKIDNKYSTYLRYEQDFRLYIQPYIGNLYLPDIDFEVVNKLKLSLFYKKSIRHSALTPKTINMALGTLCKFFNDAIKMGFAAYNPVLAVKKFKVHRKDFRFLITEEVNKFLSYCYENNIWEKHLYHALILTGMRIGEIIGLKKDAVLLNNNLIIVKRIYCPKEMKISDTTKSGKIRKLPIGDELKTVIKESMDSNPDSEFVFPDTDGSIMNYKGVSSWRFKAILREVGIKECGIHSLRHTYASHYMMNGGKIFDLKELLGHSDINTTMMYAHFSPDNLQNCRNVVSFGINNNNITDIPCKILKFK